MNWREKVRLGYPLTVEDERERAEASMRLRGADVQEVIKGKGDAIIPEQQKVGTYSYLATEDTAFARAFRLSEDDFLALFGGLGAYKLHQIDRSRMRGEGFEIQSLPTEIGEDSLRVMAELKLTERDSAKFHIDEQKKKVAGCLSASDATKKLKDIAKARKSAEEQAERMTLSWLEGIARDRFGFQPGTQSSKDAVAEMLDKVKRGLLP